MTRAVDALGRAADEGKGCVTVIGAHGTWIARALFGLGCAVDADFWFNMPMPAVYKVHWARGLTWCRDRGLRRSARLAVWPPLAFR